ncbi:MAG TPA: transporter substrate-binding domain-containing protein [Firmicutes bacterium]|nr:transporter substrate-binding domain-containing protein [Bacillota bacterium]
MKWKKWLALLMAAVMTLSMAACTKDAGSAGSAGTEGGSNESSGEKDTLVLGTSADFAPYEYHKMIDGKDTILGFDVALARQIAEDMGKELVIKDMEFGNLITELNNGTVDLLAAGLSPTEERKQQVDFSEPYYFGEQSIIIREEDADKYKSADDFEGASIAAQVNSIQEGIVKEQFPKANLVSLPKLPDEIMSLTTGKVDGVVVEVAVAEGFIAQNPGLMIADIEVPYDATGSCIAVKKGNTELLEQINKTIAEVKENGKMDEFIKEAGAQAEY